MKSYKLKCHGCGRGFLSRSGLYTHSLFLCDKGGRVKEEMGDGGETILLSCSLSCSPVVAFGGLRGEEWLQDTLIRCHSGEVVGCHAVILAASSTVLRCALGDSSRGEDPAVVLMLDYSRDQVDNLLDLLYTGTAEKTPELDSLMRMLEVETGCNEIKELPSTPKVCSIKDTAVKEEAIDESYTEDAIEFDYSPDIDINNYIQIKKQDAEKEDWKIEKSINNEVKKRVRCQKGQRRSYIGREDNTKFFDQHVNSQLLIKQINENPDQTIQEMEKSGIPIFHYQCNICPGIISSIFQYSFHTKTKHPDKINDFNIKFRRYKCFVCPKRFLSLKDKRNHINKIHPDKSNPGRAKIRLVCPFENCNCNKWSKVSNIKGKVKYAEHIIEHELGAKGLVCFKCDKKFSYIMALQKHIKESHLTINVVCPDCGHVSTDEGEFKKHNKKMHQQLKSKSQNQEKVEHCCDLCAQQFSSTVNFKYHMKRIHGDASKMVSCETCGKIFLDQFGLDRHTPLHEDPTIPCPHCAKLLHTEQYLVRHIKSQHTENSDKSYKCDQCGKGFINNQGLQDHMNVHLGLKPYTCRYCSAAFTNKSNCNAHEKKSHPDLFTKLTKGTFGTRVKDRDKGLVQVTKEDLLISSRPKVYLDEHGRQTVMSPNQ